MKKQGTHRKDINRGSCKVFSLPVRPDSDPTLNRPLDGGTETETTNGDVPHESRGRDTVRVLRGQGDQL